MISEIAEQSSYTLLGFFIDFLRICRYNTKKYVTGGCAP